MFTEGGNIEQISVLKQVLSKVNSTGIYDIGEKMGLLTHFDPKCKLVNINAFASLGRRNHRSDFSKGSFKRIVEMEESKSSVILSKYSPA